MRLRLSLLGKFSLLSLVVIAALGVAIGAVLHQRIERRALIDAGRDAALLGRIGVQGQITPPELEHGLSPRRVEEVGRKLRASSLADSGLARVKIYDRRGTVVYSDDRASIGESEEDHELEEALEGEIETEVTHGTDDSGRGEKMLEAYVPLRWRANSPIAGVVEIYIPYAPVAQSIADDTRTLALLLAGGLLLLYAERDELELHYQPKVALGSGEVIGAEALVRWRHPQRGLLMPADFVSLAERSGLIGDLTRCVLDKALAQCAAWRVEGIDLPVAVNLAAANIVDVDLPAAVTARLERHGLPADRLECEISEDTMMVDPHRAAGVLHRLRALGVRLSLDDFGTGRSSLAYLKQLPLDDVKIDRSFVASMAEDTDDAAIVGSTIELARSLGLGVVAEGVETEQVLDQLTALRCDIAQGYYLSRPLQAGDFECWLAARAVASA